MGNGWVVGGFFGLMMHGNGWVIGGEVRRNCLLTTENTGHSLTNFATIANCASGGFRRAARKALPTIPPGRKERAGYCKTVHCKDW